MARMNMKLDAELSAKFKDWLRAGKFPEVGYHCEKSADGSYSMEGYAMLEYSKLWTRLSRLCDSDLKAAGYPEGVFTSNRKNRNPSFLNAVHSIVGAITEERVLSNPDDRMRGWMD